jgi:hypothetical protein
MEVDLMELEERIARLESLVVEKEKLSRWEFKVFKWGLFILFVIAVFALVIWGGCEGLLFVIQRITHVIDAIAG